MPKKTILVIDDEPDILEMLSYHLEKDGFSVNKARDGEEGIRLCELLKPDLILLDLMMPGMDGHQVCYRLKTNPEFNSIPIMMLTARKEETDEVVGLKIGADDYIKKPFSPRILLARIASVLRRHERKESQYESDEKIIRGKLTLDPNTRDVMVGTKKLELTANEFRILELLAKHPGWVMSREKIISDVMGEDSFITYRTIDVHMSSLRKKLGAGSVYIKTVHGDGYKFSE